MSKQEIVSFMINKRTKGCLYVLKNFGYTNNAEKSFNWNKQSSSPFKDEQMTHFKNITFSVKLIKQHAT